MPKEQITYPVAEEDGFVYPALSVYWGKDTDGNVQLELNVSADRVREVAGDHDITAHGFFSNGLTEDETDKLIKVLQRAKRAQSQHAMGTVSFTAHP